LGFCRPLIALGRFSRLEQRTHNPCVDIAFDGNSSTYAVLAGDDNRGFGAVDVVVGPVMGLGL